LSSKRRDKLHGNNPNLEKVNRLTQTRDFGLVFITNAEKVVMEKLSMEDQQIADPAGLFYDEKKAAEVVKVNALREKLSQIPGISVILDEAHHFFSSSGDDEKKLKLAVDVLNQHGHVCTVLGFSGTPYLWHHVPLAGSKVKLSQIQLITYLKARIDEFNAKRGKKNGGELIETNGNGNGGENGNGETNGSGEEAARPSVSFKPVTISDTGLELIEAVQFDTTLRKDGVWVSNRELEDKAGPKEKIKGHYAVMAKAFKVKFRNIAGDEINLDYPSGKA
jgi:hypothetical protein